jgi:hypothetical protein
MTDVLPGVQHWMSRSPNEKTALEPLQKGNPLMFGILASQYFLPALNACGLAMTEQQQFRPTLIIVESHVMSDQHRQTDCAQTAWALLDSSKYATLFKWRACFHRGRRGCGRAV